MGQNPNQFSQNAEVGDIDLQGGASNVMSVLAAAGTATLPAGTAVKMADVAGKMPQVTKTTADADEVLGFVVHNFKKGSYEAGEALEIAIKGTIMYMTAGAAIARGAEVEYDVSEEKVITEAGTNPKVGWALDKAAADGDLIRVYIETPYAFAR